MKCFKTCSKVLHKRGWFFVVSLTVSWQHLEFFMKTIGVRSLKMPFLQHLTPKKCLFYGNDYPEC